MAITDEDKLRSEGLENQTTWRDTDEEHRKKKKKM
jgi:hypothetical protein